MFCGDDMQLTIRQKTNKAALNDLEKKISQKVSMQVGWFPQAKYKESAPVAMVACTHEFGNAPIPARPFMRPTAKERAQEWTKTFKASIKQGDVKYALNRLGFAVEGDIRKTISEIWNPPLKRATIYARLRKHGWFNRELSEKKRKNQHIKLDKIVGTQAGIAKPLIDTGYLIESLTHEVKYG